jgi:PAP2 superfamily
MSYSTGHRTSRRRFFSYSVHALAFAAMTAGARADDSNVDEILRLYGRPTTHEGPPDLEFLRQAQENRLNVPITLEDFNIYLDQLPLIQHIRSGQSPDLYHLMQWNALALDLTAQDHTNIPGVTDSTYAEQFGPHRSSWALAICHLAMFEAANTIFRTHKSYKNLQAQILSAVATPVGGITPKSASVRSALAYAAYETLTVVYKNKTAYTNAVFNRLDLSNQDPDAAKLLGQQIGKAAAKAVLESRQYNPATKAFGDGSQAVSGTSSLPVEPTFASLYTSPTPPREWDVDPITLGAIALGGHWDKVTPFVVDPSNLFLPPGPPDVSDTKFKDAYDEVRKVGGDPNPPNIGARHKTGTIRTGGEFSPINDSNQTLKAIFWAYDGTPLLCAPPRLYNMVAVSVALRERPINKVEDMAHYLALVNVALAEAGIAAWTAKYKFHHSRPVTYIRKVDPNTIVLNNKNSDFTPLGGQVSNGGPPQANLTPPFPSYPSGHAVFGGALFEVMRHYFKGETGFRFVSDEYNGFNRGPVGGVRPRFERRFKNFATAEAENAQSRIWMGIHWQYDAKDGIKQGNDIGKAVFEMALKD